MSKIQRKDAINELVGPLLPPNDSHVNITTFKRYANVQALPVYSYLELRIYLKADEKSDQLHYLNNNFLNIY